MYKSNNFTSIVTGCRKQLRFYIGIRKTTRFARFVMQHPQSEEYHTVCNIKQWVKQFDVCHYRL